MKYDLIIIGMGISGISAAIYAKNSGLNILMLDKDMPGGLVNRINIIENYPGLGKISGPDLSYKLFNSINDLNISYKILEVKEIKLKDDYKEIITENESFLTKRVIIATGRKNRWLGLEHEKELIGHGISTCALCDGNLYKGKKIALVGGGNSAIEEAIYLADIVDNLVVIHRSNEFRADKNLIEELKRKDNVEFLMESNITKLIKEDNFLKSIVVNEDKQLDVSGLFIYIGFEPNIEFIKDLNITDKDGYIEINEKFETNIKGIYAVGDAIKKDVYQLVTAASDGAVAAINVYKSLNKTIDKD